MFFNSIIYFNSRIFLPVFLCLSLCGWSQNVTAATLKELMRDATKCGMKSRSKPLRITRNLNRLIKKVARDLAVVNHAMACQTQFGGYDTVIRKYSRTLKKNQLALRKLSFCKFHSSVASACPLPTARLAKFIAKSSEPKGKRLCRSWIAAAKR